MRQAPLTRRRTALPLMTSARLQPVRPLEEVRDGVVSIGEHAAPNTSADPIPFETARAARGRTGAAPADACQPSGADGPRRGSGTANARPGGHRPAARDRLASARRSARRLRVRPPGLTPARMVTVIRSSISAPPCRPDIALLSHCRVPCGCTGSRSERRTGMNRRPRPEPQCPPPRSGRCASSASPPDSPQPASASFRPAGRARSWSTSRPGRAT